MAGCLTIGKLAAATGVSVETIRYYERAGLIAAPARTSSNYRCFARSDVSRLHFIRRLRDLGFSLERVRKLLGVRSKDDAPCSVVEAVTLDHLAELDQKIADLLDLRRELLDAIAKCSGGPVAKCGIINSIISDGL